MLDPQLMDQQVGFRKDRSCIDQNDTLRIILEQLLELNSLLFINFIDYEKQFDSRNRESLWKFLRHHGVPEKLTNIIRNSYGGMTYRVIHEGQLTNAFCIKTGVRQALTMTNRASASTRLDNEAINKEMHEKASTIAAKSARLGLNIPRGKRKVLRINSATNPSIML